MPVCIYNRVRERDIDVLFMNSFITDKDFAKLLIDKTKYAGMEPEVLSGELSHTELNLGESDITLTVKLGDKTVGFLVEDKIDAIAMEDQHGRYIKRGKKGIQKQFYDDFEVFLIAPLKYYQNNAEAKKYEHYLAYEEIKEYFDSNPGIENAIRSQQIGQAIEYAKKPAEVNINEKANTFFRKYKAYKDEYYPNLDLRTKEDSNGWWVHYGILLGNAYIMHKMQEGYVDLTFPGAAVKYEVVLNIANWLAEHGIKCRAEKTGKAGSVRIIIPKLKVQEKEFEEIEVEKIESCFKAISALTDYANMVAAATSLVKP